MIKNPLLFIPYMLFGILPAAIYFIWIEQNCSLPFIFGQNSFSNIKGELWSLQTLSACLWNLILFVGFGCIHSALAQPEIRQPLFSRIPERDHRPIYLITTGSTLFVLMMSWQHIDYVVWDMVNREKNPWTSEIISMGLYAICCSFLNKALSQFDGGELMGYAQWRPSRIQMPPQGKKEDDENNKNTSSGSKCPILLTSGIYSFCRHPVYFFTLMSYVLTPYMTFDRLLVTILALLYLAVGVPIEERKLIKEFGAQYERYRKQVPAIFPFLKKSINQ